MRKERREGRPRAPPGFEGRFLFAYFLLSRILDRAPGGREGCCTRPIRERKRPGIRCRNAAAGRRSRDRRGRTLRNRDRSRNHKKAAACRAGGSAPRLSNGSNRAYAICLPRPTFPGGGGGGREEVGRREGQFGWQQ